jgi:hypothetical protein
MNRIFRRDRMTPFLRRRQCRSFFLVALLGVTLAVYNSVTGFWIGTGVAIAGIAFALGFMWKNCRHASASGETRSGTS